MSFTKKVGWFWFHVDIVLSSFVVLKEVQAKTSPSDMLEVANQMLTTTLIKNLANMDLSTKRNTVRIRPSLKLISCFNIILI